METIAVASDHGGYELKEMIIGFLDSQKVGVIDCGTDSTESVDYPIYASSSAAAASAFRSRQTRSRASDAHCAHPRRWPNCQESTTTPTCWHGAEERPIR